MAKSRSSASDTAQGLLIFFFSSFFVSGSHSKKKLAGTRQRRCFHGSRHAPLEESLSARALMELKPARGVFDQYGYCWRIQGASAKAIGRRNWSIPYSFQVLV